MFFEEPGVFGLNAKVELILRDLFQFVYDGFEVDYLDGRILFYDIHKL